MNKNYRDLLGFIGEKPAASALAPTTGGKVIDACNCEKNEANNDEEISSGRDYLEAIERIVKTCPDIIDKWKVGQIYSGYKENRKQQKECLLPNGSKYYVNLDITIDVMKKNYKEILDFVHSHSND